MINPRDHVLEWLDDYVHDNLRQEDVDVVRNHCDGCDVCAAGLADAQRRNASMKAVPPSEASEKLVKSTIDAIETKAIRRQLLTRRVTWVAVAVTAAAILIVGSFNLRFALMRPSPYDLQVKGPSRFLIGGTASLDIGVLHHKNKTAFSDIPVEVTLCEPKSQRLVTLASFKTRGSTLDRPKIKIPDWADGQYELRITATASAASETVVRQVELRSPFDLNVAGQTSFRPDTLSSMRVGVFKHRTNTPYPDVPVEVTLHNRDNKQTITLASFTSGNKMIARPQFKLPDWDDSRCELRVIAKRGAATQTLVQHVELRRAWKLMLSTDKPVYQPGQTIHMRALALEKPHLKPMSGKEVVFSIMDPKGNLVFKQRDVTSKFGITATDCLLATEINEGSYNIECQIGTVTSRQTVTVEKYVLPKFKIDIQLDKPFYAPGEQVTGSVEARYFFGKPLVAADLAIDVQAAGFSERRLAEMEGKSDTNGRFDFEFTLPDGLVGREQDSGNARFYLTAKVVDGAGQTHVAGVSRVVSAHPIQIAVIPQSGALVRGVPNTIYLFANYVDGRPASARMVVNGSGVEFETNSFGVALFELTPDQARVGLTIKAIDEEGRIGRQHVDLTCGSVAGDFVIRTDKAVYDGGETMTINAIGRGVEPVFIDLIKDGQVMLTKTIRMTDAGQPSAVAVDLPPDLFGTIRLDAYRFGQPGFGSGLAVRKSRLVVVRQAGQLRVETEIEDGRDLHRPGETIRLNFKLMDRSGTPIPGAISLAAVDEAVFSVLNQGADLESVFFLLEQELLKPVYAIYSGWRPLMNANVPADRIAFDQALLSKTAASFSGSNTMLLNRTSASGAEPRSMSLKSFPKKDRQIRRQRRNGIGATIIAWVGLGCTWFMIGVLYATVRIANAWGISSGWSVCGICLSVTVCIVGLLASAVHLTLAGAAGNDSSVVKADVGSSNSADAPGGKFTSLDDSPKLDDASLPRLRERFPETLLWKPHLVTDENGCASLELNLADSITSWRLTASAVSGDGQLGGSVTPIKVFQPFFVDFDLPPALTRGDEVHVPVVVYNYLDKAQNVELKLELGDWFELLAPDKSTLAVDVPAGEVRSVSFPLRVNKVGKHNLQITARAGDDGDAVRRQIEVVPDGRPVEQTVSGRLFEPVETNLEIPNGVIDGSVRAILKLHPSSFSQLVEGLDAIFRMPTGCFEQTSSSTYPNVLALEYLQQTEMTMPAVEAKARQYIHVGYQRLISFEVSGGGFSWFGNAPANSALTAYGLMEFEDMSRVHDVDQNLINRTRRWLLSKRQNDGSWSAAENRLHDDWSGSRPEDGNENLGATAFIAWAVFRDGNSADQAGTTLDYLLSHRPESIKSPYVLALVVNAIVAMDQNNDELKSYVAQLESLRQSNEKDQVWWTQSEHSQTAFYGSGVSGNIETTAMAAIALMKSGGSKTLVRDALVWLIGQKDPNGTWHSTQATVLALKAILMGTDESLGGDETRRIKIALGGETIRTIEISSDQSEVVQQVDLSNQVTNAGAYQLTLSELTDTATGYQVILRYHVAGQEPPSNPSGPLSVDIKYDRETLNVNESIAVIATVTNNMDRPAPMVILDLPIPGGFAIEPGDLDQLRATNKIAKFQLTPRRAIVYLEGLAPGDALRLPYRLKATMPVKVTVPGGQAYEYYDPDIRGSGGSAKLRANDA